MIYFPTLTLFLELFTLHDNKVIFISLYEYIIRIYLSCQGFSTALPLPLAAMGVSSPELSLPG
jgi:hypothetical protein